jgi:hypothetical protein
VNAILHGPPRFGITGLIAEVNGDGVLAVKQSSATSTAGPCSASPGA